MTEMQHDHELIGRVLNGDLHAFEQLIKPYEKLVFYMVSRIIADEEDAKDVSQEIFIKLYRQLRSYRGEARLSTWIGQIAYTTSINFLKRNKRYAERHASMEAETISNDTISKIDNKEMAALIKEEINKLPVHYRTVITLYHLNEFSYTEIATITAMPEGTVKGYLYRARTLLKEKLKSIIK